MNGDNDICDYLYFGLFGSDRSALHLHPIDLNKVTYVVVYKLPHLSLCKFYLMCYLCFTYVTWQSIFLFMNAKFEWHHNPQNRSPGHRQGVLWRSPLRAIQGDSSLILSQKSQQRSTSMYRKSSARRPLFIRVAAHLKWGGGIDTLLTVYRPLFSPKLHHDCLCMAAIYDNQTVSTILN